MYYESKSILENLEEFEKDIGFLFKMNMPIAYNQDFKDMVEDWIKFNYGDDTDIVFPEFGRITVQKHGESPVFVIYPI